MVEDLRPIRQHRQRGIVAHRSDGFLAVLRHRRQDHAQIFLRVAERLLPIEQRDLRRRRRRGLGHVFERKPTLRDPLPIGLLRRKRALQLIVVDDASLLQVDQQHLARLQAPFLDDLALGNVENADFRGHYDVIVVGDDVARRTQAVAVERCTDLTTVGERHRCGTIPRLHQCRVIFVKCPTILVHQRIARPRFGNHHHHRVRERIATHRQELERVIEGRRIGLAFVDQWPQLRQIVAENLRCDRAFAGAYPVEVAA